MQKKTAYILIISIILAILAIISYILSVLYVGGMGSSLKSLNEESVFLDGEFGRMQSIKKIAENSTENNLKIYKYIISSGNEGSIEFVKRLEDLADKYLKNYTTNSIEIISTDELSAINKEYLSVKMTAFGGKDQLLGFTNRIKNAPYNIQIKTLSLSKSFASEAKVSDYWQIDLNILIIKEK